MGDKALLPGGAGICNKSSRAFDRAEGANQQQQSGESPRQADTSSDRSATSEGKNRVIGGAHLRPSAIGSGL